MAIAPWPWTGPAGSNVAELEKRAEEQVSTSTLSCLVPDRRYGKPGVSGLGPPRPLDLWLDHRGPEQGPVRRAVRALRRLLRLR